ncbi:MAG: conjugative relaxase [Chryseobacterium sp.]|nr:conjugative relaxase [Chryseobacterium sp.]
MIRMFQTQSAKHASAYFKDALVKSDYYMSDQELPGFWQGKLATRLNLSGINMETAFIDLCENRQPGTQTPLTPRTKDNRKVGYDINFHCPKSVSLLHAFAPDSHILDAFRDSASLVMSEIEADAKTRVRINNQQSERSTGELVWAHFVHQTARPVQGQVPDPHLHSHCFVFNATWDETEQRTKAGEFRDIKRDMPYYQAMFHKTLADKLTLLGYGIRKTDKSFEIEAVPQKVIDLFSKRTDQIGRIAKEKGISNAKELDQLGARTRATKQKGRDMAVLRTEWRAQINDLGEDGKSAATVRFAPSIAKRSLTASHCLEHAVSHHFERASVVADRKMLETAMRHSIGTNASIADIKKAFDANQNLIHVDEGSRRMCTTKEVLGEEKRMVDLAMQGKGKIKPLYEIAPELKLSGQQGKAVAHILTTSNRVSIIRGAAGTGKTTLLKEAIDKIEDAGKSVIVVAPSAQASRGVLKEEEGIDTAETVARLLVDEKIQERLKGQVLWVDEAGLLGIKDMTALLELTTRQNAQLVLGGDTRQHASVVRGDALRVLNKFARIPTAEVSKIYRQQNEEYKSAVKDLSDGNMIAGFNKLDQLGFIKTVEQAEAAAQLATGYLEVIKSGKSALVVCPTHAQADEVTQLIRNHMKGSDMLGKKEIDVLKLKNLNLTDAEKADLRNYENGQVVKFHQNVSGFPRGSLWSVKIKDKDVFLKNTFDDSKPIPISKCEYYSVYERQEMTIAKGDRVMITDGSTDKMGKRLDNGTMLTVTKVTKDGIFELINENSQSVYRLNKDFGSIRYAHCITSHASQGKTVDEVFIYQPSATFVATDAKQFYVSVSRGKQKAHLYTDDKEELRVEVQQLKERKSALELDSNRQRSVTPEYNQIITPKHKHHEPDREI